MKPFSPQKANTTKKIMKLKRDSLYEADYWFVGNPTVFNLSKTTLRECPFPKKSLTRL
jgi:hypothetical protein